MNTKIIECPICKMKLTSNNLQRHLNRHKNNPRSFTWIAQHVDHEGLNCKYCGKLCKSKGSLAQHECRCKLNPHRVDVKLSNNLKNQGWRKGLTKETDIRVKHNADSIKKYFETHEGTFKGKHHTQATKDKIRNIQLNTVHRDNNRNTWSLKGYYNNIFFMSTWELAYYIYMTDNNHIVEKCNNHYEYTYEGKKHMYTPDFILDHKYIIEIKGRENQIDLEKYKSIDNIVVLYEKDLKHMIEYVKKKFKIKKLSELYSK